MPVRPDPLKELLDLQERMNRLFDQTLAGERLDPPAFAPAWSPAADVYETEDGYVLEIELPGLTRDEVAIEVQGTQLVVRGERQIAAAPAAAFHRLERRYGPFARSFRFPDPIDSERVKADLREGILRVEAPRTHARPSGRSIRVERSA
jgi:HSP20 family protein